MRRKKKERKCEEEQDEREIERRTENEKGKGKKLRRGGVGVNMWWGFVLGKTEEVKKKESGVVKRVNVCVV